METLETSNLNNGILNKIFTFDESNKADLFNLMQFIFTCFIPIIILVKIINRFSPKADDRKSSLELTLEIFIETFILFFGFYIIKHVFTKIPTFSGKKIPDINITGIVIPILYTLISSNDILSDKIKILLKRFNHLWNGETNNENKPKRNSSVKVTQPISQNFGQNNLANNNTGSGNDNNNNNTSLINELPSNPVNLGPQKQQYPDYNNMFQNNSTPLVDAQTPGLISNEGFGDIMAANSVLGGSFGSIF